ncbi:MAG: ATP-grasp domain-containing protein [Pseudanabaenaceae cyanobacterium]
MWYQHSKQPTIAVGSSGSATGYTAVSALKSSLGRKGYKIVACDTNPKHLVAAATIADDFIQLPSALEDGFVSRTVELLKTSGVNLFYPIHDQEICVSASAKEYFAHNQITVCAVAGEIAKLCTDKLACTKVLCSHGIDVPETYLLADSIDCVKKFIVKPRHGNGSKFLEVINTDEELENIKRKVDFAVQDYVVQEWLSQPEITVDAFVLPDYSLVKVVCRERLEIKSGVTTKAYVFHDDFYTALALRVAKALNLFGAFCFQTRSTNNSVIDVNPRIGGATAMSILLGQDFPSAHIAYFLGYEPKIFFKDEYQPCFVTRSYREHIAYL